MHKRKEENESTFLRSWSVGSVRTVKAFSAIYNILAKLAFGAVSPVCRRVSSTAAVYALSRLSGFRISPAGVLPGWAKVAAKRNILPTAPIR